jgi:hypothetical protein
MAVCTGLLYLFRYNRVVISVAAVESMVNSQSDLFLMLMTIHLS